MLLQKPSVETTLRELVRAKGVRRVARDLNIDPASLHRSLRDGSNLKLERIKKLSDYFGYELRIMKKRDRLSKRVKPSKRIWDNLKS